MAKMIQVTYGTTTRIQTDTVSSDTPIRKFVNDKNLSTAGATIQLNGIALYSDDMDKTFEAVASGDSLTLMSVVNSKNA